MLARIGGEGEKAMKVLAVVCNTEDITDNLNQNA